MSDYGYRPAPPPEDGRPQGPRGGRPDGRAYGDARNGGRQGGSDYGWGGSQQQGGGYGQAPRADRQPYGTPASGSASVGRASGSAPAGRGSASVGRPSGSASVGGASGSASVGGAGRTGRASVGSASVGSASVGAASVSPGRPGSASEDGERAGRASVAGSRRAGKGPRNKSDLEGEGGKKKRKRLGRKMLAAMIALGVLFVAGATIVGSYFFVTVDDPESISRAGESSSFYFADGTQAGGYGDTLRLQAEAEEIPDIVKQALVATEDRKFYDHSGVDFTRTMGALVNNLTGGSTQGASTITQQYAGMVMSIRNEISYDRKAKEAAMAFKMEQKFTKDEIITAYLNLAWFGRGATGIEAAAKQYFDKPLAELTPAEAAFIIIQVKSPDGTYDPYYNEDNGGKYDPEATQARWNYAMGAMVEEGYLSQADRDAATLPEPITEFNAAGSWGGNTNVGFIINELDGYVFEELESRYGLTKEDLYGGEDGTGGYSVKLTIDPQIQDQLAITGSRGDIKVKTNEAGEYLNEAGEVVDSIEAAEKDLTSEGYAQFVNDNPDAALEAYEAYMMTAMVAIDPETGAIVGYYGGDNGFGVDKAGPESPHPSSSTFKMVTAATAMSAGDSINSWFNANSPRKFASLTDDASETCIGGGDYPDCTLRNGSQRKDLEMTLTKAVRDSKNTPMYSIAEHYGANTILDLADKMGLSVMNQARTLTDSDNKTWDGRSVNYRFYDDGTYSQHGHSVDGEGTNVTDESGNWDAWAPVQVDENCNPIVNTDGVFLQTEDEQPVKCEIGKKGSTDPFYNHIAFGQYPTSVRDMASIYATIANDGAYHESHFVASVTNNKGEEVEEVRPLESGQPIDKTIAQDLQWVGSEIGGESATDKLPRDYFGKTGTWEAACEDCESSWNAHAWYVGAIPQLSIAAWVGNVTSESMPIADPDGNKNHVFGSNTAYPVWFKAMERIIEAKGLEEESWAGKAEAGNETWWDIEEAGPNEGGEFCAAKPDNPLCADQQEENDKKDCEDGGGTWNDGQCETPPDDDTPPGQETSDEPSDNESSGEENCGTWPLPDCEEEPSQPEESSPSPDNNGRPEGN